MNKTELINIISRKTDMEFLKAKQLIDTFCDTIMSEVKQGNRVQISGFGTFELRNRKSKKGRNPQTGESIIIPERSVPFFKPSKDFKN
ncbi:MAG: HU family DNA-binding protein [Syntrophomonadaceae bacterium]